MSRQHRKNPFIRLRKRKSTNNIGGLVEKFSNSKAALIGYLTGKGLTSRRIAKLLDDGTSASTIRKMWDYWELPTQPGAGRNMETISVVFTSREREGICKSAEVQGITPEEFIRRVSFYTSRDNLYDGVVDDRD